MKVEKPLLIPTFVRNTPGLVQFLETEKCLREFIQNLDPSIKRTSPISISSAFVWVETPQGPDYWYRINLKWINNKQ